LSKSEKFIYLFFVLAFLAAIFLLLFVVFSWDVTIFHVTEVESEIVNGILTASSIIFGFQSAFFKVPRKGKVRIFWISVFIGEALVIGSVGYNYVNSVMSLGYLTTNTLLSAFFSLALNLFNTVLLAFVDFLVFSE